MGLGIEEIMAEMADLKEIKKTLTSWLKEEVNHGKECFDTKTCGDVSDIIKDTAETMKECCEALYYMTVIEAMESGKGPAYGGEDVYGYNHRHMANGQFAQSGKGHVTSGYTPYVDQEPYIDAYLHDPNFQNRMRHGSMGYNDGGRGENRSEYGEIYDNYRTARRHYQNSNAQTDKEEMDQHCMRYMSHTVKHLKDMWKDADPMLKKRLKEDFGEEMVKILDAMQV